MLPVEQTHVQVLLRSGGLLSHEK